MRTVRAAVLLALLISAAACSVQMTYNNLDRLARWSVSDYIDMTPAQRAYFDASMQTLWRWHRTNHLPAYAALLNDVAVRYQDGASEADMQALVDQVMVWAEEVEAHGMPIAATLLASLSDAQVAELADALVDSNDEIAEPEEGLTVAQAQRVWHDEFVDYFSQFSGRLTAVQNDYLLRQAGRYEPERLPWVAYRQRWQADLLALLRFRADAAGFAAGLAELAANRELYYGPVGPVFDRNEALTRETSVWLINSFTDRQRERFAERLGGLAEDFRELAAQDTDEPPDLPCLVAC